MVGAWPVEGFKELVLPEHRGAKAHLVMFCKPSNQHKSIDVILLMPFHWVWQYSGDHWQQFLLEGWNNTGNSNIGVLVVGIDVITKLEVRSLSGGTSGFRWHKLRTNAAACHLARAPKGSHVWPVIWWFYHLLSTFVLVLLLRLIEMRKKQICLEVHGAWEMDGLNATLHQAVGLLGVPSLGFKRCMACRKMGIEITWQNDCFT